VDQASASRNPDDLEQLVSNGKPALRTVPLAAIERNFLLCSNRNFSVCRDTGLTDFAVSDSGTNFFNWPRHLILPLF